MRILLLGKLGQLGWELHRTLAPVGEVLALDYPEINLAEPESVREIIRQAAPTVIINATAYTAVDRAESEPDIAFAVNAAAPGVLAQEAGRLGAALVHYSTDYVFDGVNGRVYTEMDTPNPINVYGQSKLGGERAIQEADGNYLILRTSWVYSLRRESFVTKVLHWVRAYPVLRIVSDQVGNPTWCRMLAEASAHLLTRADEDVVGWLRERKGVYHLAGLGAASRLEWARAILKHDPQPEEQLAREIQPALTADFPTPARRPLYTALDCSKFIQTFGIRLPDWEAALQLAMEAN